MTKFYDAVYSFERVGGYQFVKLYISMFEKWLESPQWLLAVSKPEVRMRVTSAWGQEYVELTRPKIESRDPIFFTGTRSRSRVSGNDQLFPRGSEFGPNLEIPAGPAIQLRPGPV